jgi:hydroxyacyl-ACP dehydratase HTD2-like protein with hotdog domain
MTQNTGQQRFFETVHVGDELPPMVKMATRAQLFLYSAASSNPHRIHYDREYASTEGHPDVLVHGPLQGAWLSQFVTDWMGPQGRLLTLSWQNRARAFPERELTFRGRVTAVDDGVVALELREEDDTGQVCMPGAATVRLPRRN